ncbi:M15 family metallopeptidase [Herbaspirillum sp. alder98]|uniref:M15 family metallopeptidase n=1 Tax=Herbaspirillum sp. alder98 TaxID=2913096 RepID=UPI001CD8D6BC|nr:M15 family metallopeptidase [Herbaspirillum sp. alder98]MCA1325470.1 M15 family metallopeptidase [Herbaspirillum sp. alder98]
MNPPLPFLYRAARPLVAGMLLSLLQISPSLAASDASTNIKPLSRSQCAAMKQHQVISADNPVPCARLSRVSFDYHDFDGNVRQGAVVVLDAVAPQVESLFGELLLRSVPLAGAQPMEAFDGDDEKSMAANNTSAFNGRPMTGGGGWSKHAYGVAIDINPLQNPYVSQSGNGQQQVLPAAGADFLQRQPAQPGMAEDVVGVFYDHGFLIWGGNWKQPIDYQHFEIGSRAFVARLVALAPAQARAEFERYVARYRRCTHTSAPTDDDAPEDTALRDSCAARSRR